MECSTEWRINDLRFLISFGLVNISSSLEFMVRHNIVGWILVVLVSVDMGDVMGWWWWYTSDGYITGVRKFSSDEFTNVYLLTIGSFKQVPLFVSYLFVDIFSIESLNYLNGIELCKLVEDREGLMEEKEENESVLG